MPLVVLLLISLLFTIIVLFRARAEVQKLDLLGTTPPERCGRKATEEETERLKKCCKGAPRDQCLVLNDGTTSSAVSPSGSEMLYDLVCVYKGFPS